MCDVHRVVFWGLHDSAGDGWVGLVGVGWKGGGGGFSSKVLTLQLTLANIIWEVFIMAPT